MKNDLKRFEIAAAKADCTEPNLFIWSYRGAEGCELRSGQGLQ